MILFKNEVGVEIKEDKADVEDDNDEEDMEDVNLDNDRERNWRMVLEDNDGGVENGKSLLHMKRWDFYVNVKEKMVKGGYSVEVVGHDWRRVLW